MAIVLAMGVATFILSLIGMTRRIGFWGTFFASLLLTPMGGLVLVALSGPVRPVRTRGVRDART